MLLALFGWSKIAGQAVAGWLSRRSLIEIICLLLAVGWAIDHVASHRLAAKLQHQLTACSSARHADAESYRKAQVSAQAANHAQVQKIEQQQQRISDAQIQTLNDRIARLSDELRAHGPAAQSHPDGPGIPQVPNASAGADGAPGLCLSPAQLLRAAQDEERHNELIDWVQQIAKLDPNTGAAH